MSKTERNIIIEIGDNRPLLEKVCTLIKQLNFKRDTEFETDFVVDNLESFDNREEEQKVGTGIYVKFFDPGAYVLGQADYGDLIEEWKDEEGGYEILDGNIFLTQRGF